MAQNDSSPVLIVGAGHAAGVLARTLRDEGFSGAITLVGEEPYPPYERPPLSKALLLGQQSPADTFVQPLEWYAQAGVDFRLGCRATAVDLHERIVMLDDGSPIQFGTLVFATGARARPLNVPGATLPGIHLLRSMDDAASLRDALKPGRRVVVVGAGLLGLELAAAARCGGAEVMVLEAEQGPLQRVLPAAIGAHVADLHRARGVAFRFGVTVTRFHGSQRIESVALSDGSFLEADLAIVSIGACPNDDLARAAGLAVGDGILVDDRCRTSAPSVYAVGDVARHPNPFLGAECRLESWQNAQNQAQACARVIAGKDVAYAEVPWFWTDQYDANIQFVGLTVGALETVGRGNPATGSFSLFCIRNGIVVGAVGVNRPRDVRAARALIAGRRRVDTARLADDSRNLNEAIAA
jgi:3-phenylpropionate/trans-cinnamate dioxygenase ferredoxin reductase subunit